MALTEKEKLDYLAEALDSQRVVLHCEKHNYFGPTKKGIQAKPAQGCARCWMVFYVKHIASMPPHQRAQQLDELEEVLHKVVESVEKGTWDFKPYDRPVIKIESE